MRIELLTKLHDLEAFDCGVAMMNEYLRSSAFKHSLVGYSKTYVAVENEPDVIGYHSITPTSVAPDDIPQSTPSFPISAYLLARLAVDLNYQGQGLGKELFLDALKKAYEMFKIGGGFAVIIDALNEDVKNFYMKYGFKELNDKNLVLYLPMKQVAKLFPDN